MSRRKAFKKLLNLLPLKVRTEVEEGKSLTHVVPGTTKIGGKLVLAITYAAFWKQGEKYYWDVGKTRKTLAKRFQDTYKPGSREFIRQGSPTIARGHGIVAETLFMVPLEVLLAGLTRLTKVMSWDNEKALARMECDAHDRFKEEFEAWGCRTKRNWGGFGGGMPPAKPENMRNPVEGTFFRVRIPWLELESEESESEEESSEEEESEEESSEEESSESSESSES
eukprot:CAMPEP_0182494414 /NCGR_PEP_ID=MMETSP1321-20130603/3285_1 /TAXON_ID=91990 /ORGANISM="Bolidomonas sp., Strain RCC1657" /LENGTH=224 /DNA_ID=CAMNT_0024697483 /DNA_START=143 /DNA_END=813 /DNA_ORIENTATION=+